MRQHLDGSGWGNHTTAEAGMGAVEGHWRSITSSRAELRGVLDAMARCRQLVQCGTLAGGDVRHTLDNESVVKQYCRKHCQQIQENHQDKQ